MKEANSMAQLSHQLDWLFGTSTLSTCFACSSCTGIRLVLHHTTSAYPSALSGLNAAADHIGPGRTDSPRKPFARPRIGRSGQVRALLPTYTTRTNPAVNSGSGLCPSMTLPASRRSPRVYFLKSSWNDTRLVYAIRGRCRHDASCLIWLHAGGSKETTPLLGTARRRHLGRSIPFFLPLSYSFWVG
ncbi:hypothetical protein CPB85DRAFT_213257 [Mucidula mucida]|nr:hypothetical protein CPB85DRAFT_213257 [Mucidula mucida]